MDKEDVQRRMSAFRAVMDVSLDGLVGFEASELGKIPGAVFPFAILNPRSVWILSIQTVAPH